MRSRRRAVLMEQKNEEEEGKASGGGGFVGVVWRKGKNPAALEKRQVGLMIKSRTRQDLKLVEPHGEEIQANGSVCRTNA